MSFLGETAATLDALLRKHERSTHRIEELRVTPAILAQVKAQGFQIGRQSVLGREKRLIPIENSGRFKANYMANSRQAAREWLDQPRPRKISQQKIGAKHGVSQASVSIAVDRERAARRQAHIAGDKTALLAGRAA